MKFKLLESVFTSFGWGNKTYYIYKNPTSQELNSKEDSKNNRAIIDINGDLYMEAKWIGDSSEEYESYSNIIHNHLINRLQEHGKLSNIDEDWWKGCSDSTKYMVCVQRQGTSNDFYLAESYESELLLDEDAVNEVFKKAKKKNPYLGFYFRNILGVRHNEI
jgi:hypothetical protein